MYAECYKGLLYSLQSILIYIQCTVTPALPCHNFAQLFFSCFSHCPYKVPHFIFECLFSSKTKDTEDFLAIMFLSEILVQMITIIISAVFCMGFYV